MQLMQQSFNMEQARFASDSAKDTMLQVETMKGAAVTLKTQMKDIDVGSIDDFQDDLMDMYDDMNEIQEVLSRSYAMPDVDEGDLEQELMDLEVDVGDEELPSYLTNPEIGDLGQLPAVPTTPPSAALAAPQRGNL